METVQKLNQTTSKLLPIMYIPLWKVSKHNCYNTVLEYNLIAAHIREMLHHLPSYMHLKDWCLHHHLFNNKDNIKGIKNCINLFLLPTEPYVK